MFIACFLMHMPRLFQQYFCLVSMGCPASPKIAKSKCLHCQIMLIFTIKDYNYIYLRIMIFKDYPTNTSSSITKPTKPTGGNLWKRGENAVKTAEQPVKSVKTRWKPVKTVGKPISEEDQWKPLENCSDFYPQGPRGFIIGTFVQGSHDRHRLSSDTGPRTMWAPRESGLGVEKVASFLFNGSSLRGPFRSFGDYFLGFL